MPSPKTQSAPPADLCALFSLQAMAQALWFVPFSNVLAAHGLSSFIKYAYTCSSIAAFISPMIGGTLADRHLPAVRVLRWAAGGTGIFLALVSFAIQQGWSGITVLVLLQISQLFFAPTWGLVSAAVLARLRAPEREYGAVRVWGTFGWMAAGLILSFALHADASPLSGYVAASVWLLLASYTYLLPEILHPPGRPPIRLRQLHGMEALVLLKDRNHRAVFLTAALYTIPLTAYYPFAVLQLRELGSTHPSAAMSLGQITEILSMYALAPLFARCQIKHLFLVGIALGAVRYWMFSLNSLAWVFVGISLHGICYTLYFISAQVYLDCRVDPAFRARAQSLLTLMSGGVGAFAGALACGFWKESCDTGAASTNWPLYWQVLAGTVAAICVIFAFAYRNDGRVQSRREAPAST